MRHFTRSIVALALVLAALPAAAASVVTDEFAEGSLVMVYDADYILVTSGTITSTAKVVVRELQKEGEKVGLLKMRVLRPFPFETVRKALGDRKKVAVIDRNISFGHHGVFYQEIKSALYPLEKRPKVFGYITGLGGRDVTPQDIRDMYFDMKKREKVEEIIWKGVKL